MTKKEFIEKWKRELAEAKFAWKWGISKNEDNVSSISGERMRTISEMLTDLEDYIIEP